MTWPAFLVSQLKEIQKTDLIHCFNQVLIKQIITALHTMKFMGKQPQKAANPWWLIQKENHLKKNIIMPVSLTCSNTYKHTVDWTLNIVNVLILCTLPSNHMRKVWRGLVNILRKQSTKEKPSNQAQIWTLTAMSMLTLPGCGLMKNRLIQQVSKAALEM